MLDFPLSVWLCHIPTIPFGVMNFKILIQVEISTKAGVEANIYWFMTRFPKNCNFRFSTRILDHWMLTD
jgi:hypothetical protein